MTLYIVSCYSPPSALKIKTGDTVNVEGWMQKENIRADRIENLTNKGVTYECGVPKVLEFLTGLPKYVSETGTVKKVNISSESIQFEFESSK